MPETRDSQWHLDKRIPVVMIVTILGGYAGGIWWASEMNARLGYIEKFQIQAQNDSGQIIQIKEQLRGIERIVARLEQYLDNRLSGKSDLGMPAQPKGPEL